MAARTAAASRVRPVPELSPEFAHLSLANLRAYRRALNTEEGRVSYWRRLIQARLDLVQSVGEGGTASVDNLRRVLTDAQVGSRRNALIAVMPADDMPPLPDLPALWESDPVPGDPAANGRLLADLARAERQLSAYRAALHARIAAATGELIARYREQPLLCLSALPLEPPVQRRAASA